MLLASWAVCRGPCWWRVSVSSTLTQHQPLSFRSSSWSSQSGQYNEFLTRRTLLGLSTVESNSCSMYQGNIVAVFRRVSRVSVCPVNVEIAAFVTILDFHIDTF